MGAMTTGAPAAQGRDRVEGRPVVLVQRWADIVWAHWRMPPAAVRALIPASLEVDVFDGSAWVGLVPFEMQALRLVLAGRPFPGRGSTWSFSEVNVRTYVTGPSGPGVWFHTLDATSHLAVLVARRAWALPYRAAKVRAELSAAQRSWEVERRDGTKGALGVALGAHIEAGALETFLTGRYRLYAPLGRRRLLSAPVRHEPWRLHEATLQRLDPGLVAAAGYAPVGSPDHLVAGDSVDVSVGWPEVLAG